MKTDRDSALILNVDDDEAKRYVVTRLLTKAGFAVKEAGSGRDALAEAFDSRPDLIVLDVNLPDLNGFEVCRTLKDDSRTGSIPILHLSATAIEARDRIEGLEGGADAYLAQNVEAAELLATIRALLRTKRAEEKARSLAAQWQTTFDSIDQGIVILDAATQVVRCNATFAGWDGRTAAEMTGVEAGSIPLLQGLPPVGTHEWRLGEKWYQRSTQPIVEGPANEARTVAVIADITERKRVSDALRTSESRLDLAQRAGRIGTFDWDIRSGRVVWNESLEKLYGFGPGEFQGRYDAWAKQLNGEDLERVEKSLREAMERRDPDIEYEFRVALRDGVRWMYARARFEYDETGKASRMIGINMDITERKAFEERMREADKLESIGLLAGGIAHDFNNLLVGILGSATLVLEDLPEDYRLRSAVAAIATAGERASELTRQLLAYAGKGHLFLEMVDLSDVARETCALAKAAIPRSVEMHLDLARDLPMVKGDRSQIQQIVMNLLLNAAEAFPAQRGMVSILTRIADPRVELSRHAFTGHESIAGPCVLLQVTDNGTGMDSATKARIFDPFFTTKFTGRGLGLAAAQGIVRTHKGAIGVESAPGEGTTFTLLLPASDEAAAARTHRRRAQGGAKGTILLVDDEAVVRTTTKMILEHKGHTVLLAKDGLEGVNLFREDPNRISLVLLDLTMPHMNGDEALSHLQEIKPDVRVVLSSGYNESEIMRIFAGRKVSGFLQKPYRVNRLIEEIDRVLSPDSGTHEATW